MKKLLFNIFRTIIGEKGFVRYKNYRNQKNREADLRKAKEYLTYRDAILQNVKAKEVINVLFFVTNLSMWKYDDLIKLLLENPRFKILVVSFIIPGFDKATSSRQQEDIRRYCDNNRIPFIAGYDFDNDSYYNLNPADHDIVIYTQPYNIGYGPWLIDAFKQHSLFIYTPYGISVSGGEYFYNTYLTNIAWKIFVGSELEKDIFKNCQSVGKDNQVVTGFVSYDRLKTPKTNPWRSKNKKKIIWAPHHSIDNKFSFENSCFELICDSMIEIAKQFENEIEFAFKPHPLLKQRLIDKWGRETADNYYNKWAEMSNTFICDGEYADLFAHSDGIIHDSASFVCEYLLTGNPGLYTVKTDLVPPGINNNFGSACFRNYYKGTCKEDIISFLTNVILAGEDPMKEARLAFVKENLLPPGEKSVGQNMMDEFLELIN